MRISNGVSVADNNSYLPSLILCRPPGRLKRKRKLQTNSRTSQRTEVHSKRLLLALILAGATAFLAGCGGIATSSDRSDDIAASISAEGGSGVRCVSSGYEITNRLDGSKTTIYSCTGDDGAKCYTEQNGIIRDETETVRLLFQGTVGTEKPDCVA